MASKSLLIVEEIAAETLAASHQVATLAEVLVDGAVEEELTEVSDGSVALDATASTRGRLDLTLAGIDELIPTGPDSLLAPYGNELRVSRGVEFSDRIELVRQGIFRIDRSTASEQGEGPQIQISGLDRSGAIIDASFEEAGQIAAGTNATDAILSLLLEVTPELAYDFAEVTAPLPLLNYSEGDDRWALCQGIATAIGAELYYNRDGLAVLRPVPSAAGEAVAAFEEGPRGVLLSAERDWDRSPVYNRIIVTGESTSLDSSTPPPRGLATDLDPLSPTYYYGHFGRKPYFYSSEFISIDVQAADAAAGILARAIGAPDQISFGSIVDPARSPSDVVAITRERLGISETHILDSVTIPLSADGSMSGTTRAVTVTS